MKKFIIVFLMMGFTAGLFAENRALLVGIADYNEPRLNLNGPETDLKLMRRIALQIGFRESEIKTLKDKHATQANILNALKQWLVKGVNPEDKVMFYYSGHGSQVPDFNGDEDDQCDEVLVPYDAVKRRALAFIIDDQLNKIFSSSKSQQIMIILDSCHSGTGTRGMVSHQAAASNEYHAYGKMIVKGDCGCNQPVNVKSLDLLEAKSGGNVNYIVLTASAQNEVARGAMTPGRGSLFTQSLYHEVRASKGAISFRRLRDRVAEKIRMVTEFYKLNPHIPQLEGNRNWFDNDFKSFASQSQPLVRIRKQGSQTVQAPLQPRVSAPARQYGGTVQQSTSMKQLFDRMLRNSLFSVRINAMKRTFRLGEKIRFSVTSTKDGYLNLVELSPTGDVVVLFPNQYSTKSAVKAWQTLDIPGSIGGFAFVGQEPVGRSRVIALVTSEPLNLFTEPVGKRVGLFKAISNSEFKSLKKTLNTRAIGVVKDEKSRKRGKRGSEYGAVDMVVKVVK